MATWSPDSWRSKPIKQSPEYPDQEALDRAVSKLSKLPRIVGHNEVVKLKRHLGNVARGDSFLLQGGDCAELFEYCNETAIESKIKLLLQMSLVLKFGADKNIVRIGRMAGQYAKPRSSPMETVTVDGTPRQVPSFRGDILNGYPLDQRALDPDRLVMAHHYSASTLGHIKTAIEDGIADLHHPFDWGLGHVRDPKLQSKYREIVKRTRDATRFLDGAGFSDSPALANVELFTSHEALVLEYEQPLTRLVKLPSTPGSRRAASRKAPPQAYPQAAAPTNIYYDSSAHFLWMGDRTRQVDHAHVEFLRGIDNPIGVKIGPTTPASDIIELLRILNPDRTPGKVTLITRYGASKVRALLPAHIRAVEESEYSSGGAPGQSHTDGGIVIWQCDPMHGNTQSTVSGIKTRHFENIFAELQETLLIHKEQGTYMGGVHLELTGEPVTECIGGSEGLDVDDLSTNYTSFCDPRLNEKQALELAFLVADHYLSEKQVDEDY